MKNHLFIVPDQLTDILRSILVFCVSHSIRVVLILAHQKVTHFLNVCT